jgi:hypothetical protein
VVQDPRIFYFNVPKLGSYLCIKMQYNSYLNEQKFKDSVSEKLRQHNIKIEVKQALEDKEATYKKDLSEGEHDALEEITKNYNLQRQKDLDIIN